MLLKRLRPSGRRRVSSRSWGRVRVWASAAGDDVDEELVDATIARHLRMKRCRQHPALPHGHDVTGGPAQHLHVGADAFDPRRADEHRVHATVEARKGKVALKRNDPGAKGVAT